MGGTAQAQHARLAGKAAVVTGAGRGIGRTAALMIARQGGRVVGADIDAASLEALAREAEADGLALGVVAADLTTEDGAARLAQAARERLGDVQILVNAAAVAAFDWIEAMSFADWRRTLAGELDSVFLVTRALWPLLCGQGGSIVNFASASAHVALDTLPGLAHCAGKGGVLAMTRQLAMEGGARGIRANTVSPGFTLTEETRRHLDNPEMMNAVRAKLMTPRLGTSEDIGWLIVYLASDESAFVTGADFRIDGGATAW